MFSVFWVNRESECMLWCFPASSAWFHPFLKGSIFDKKPARTTQIKAPPHASNFFPSPYHQHNSSRTSASLHSHLKISPPHIITYLSDTLHIIHHGPRHW